MAPPSEHECTSDDISQCKIHGDQDSCELMTIEQILNGNGSYYPGLRPMIDAYMDMIEVDPVSMVEIQKYLDLVSQKASGELLTTASWMRKFVTTHPEYKGDSVVSESIAYDLVKQCELVSRGQADAPELLGAVVIKDAGSIPPYQKPLKGAKSFDVSHGDLGNLVSKYSARFYQVSRKRKLQAEIASKEKELSELRSELTQLDAMPMESPSLVGKGAPGLQEPKKLRLDL